MAVHQHGLDRRAASRNCLKKPVDRKCVGQGLDALRGQQRMLLGCVWRPRLPEDDAETAGIGEAQRLRRQHQIEMIVLGHRFGMRHETQVARHPEMDDQTAADTGPAAVEQQVLAAPPHRRHPTPGQPLRQARRNRLAQLGHAADHPGNHLPFQLGREPAPANLDFRQLRHRLFLRQKPNNITKLSGFYAFKDAYHD